MCSLAYYLLTVLMSLLLWVGVHEQELKLKSTDVFNYVIINVKLGSAQTHLALTTPDSATPSYNYSNNINISVLVLPRKNLRHDSRA